MQPPSSVALPGQSKNLDRKPTDSRSFKQIAEQYANTVLKTPRLQLYRERHPRIDYYPSPDVMPIIVHHLKIGTDPCLAGVIDYLVRTGQRAIISGNGSQ